MSDFCNKIVKKIKKTIRIYLTEDFFEHFMRMDFSKMVDV